MAAKRKRSSTNLRESITEADATSQASDSANGSEAKATAEPIEFPFSVEYRKPPRRKSAGTPNTKRTRRGKAASGGRAPKSASGDGDASAPPSSQVPDRESPEDNGHLYTIKPHRKWDGLRKYRNFVVGQETFAINDCIFVNHVSFPEGVEVTEVDDKQFWVARVLEIRAEDEAHVYLRVFWLYWPEELPDGRQYYHGTKELVASNHMEIIDAMTVSGKADVKQWRELDEDEELSDLFWRQKFDYPTNTLKEVRKHCKCHRYYNPDSLMVFCPDCKIWLHQECLIDEIKRRVVDGSISIAPASNRTKGASKPDSPDNVVAVTADSPAKQRSKGLLQSAIALATPRKPATPTPMPAPTNGTPASSTSPSTKRKSAARLKPEMDEIQVTIVSDAKETKAIVRDFRGLTISKPKGGKKRGGRKSVVVHAILEANGETVDEGGPIPAAVEIPIDCLICHRVIT